jgi:hypothetical protein
LFVQKRQIAGSTINRKRADRAAFFVFVFDVFINGVKVFFAFINRQIRRLDDIFDCSIRNKRARIEV